MKIRSGLSKGLVNKRCQLQGMQALTSQSLTSALFSARCSTRQGSTHYCLRLTEHAGTCMRIGKALYAVHPC